MSQRSPTGRSANSLTTYAGLVVAAVSAAILLESLVVLLMIFVAGLLVLLLVTPWLAGPVATTTDSGTPVGPHRDRVLIVSASIGAGHDGAATELTREARSAGYAVDRVDFLELLPLHLGPLMRTLYHWQLGTAPSTWGWLLGRLQEQPEGGWAASLPGHLARRRLVAACGPGTRLVVSTYPLASQALSLLRLDGTLSVPTVTYLTDMSVHPLWVAPGIDAHSALHQIPATAATALGARGVEVVGPKVSPHFRPATTLEQRAARARFELPTDSRLALVVAGSWGVGDVAATVEDLIATRTARPVVVCGSNSALLNTLGNRLDVHALGWVDNMPDLMWACDLVIQNAGGLTSLEALASGLPVITYRTLPGHGETNASALDAAGWAPWARTREDLSILVEATLAPAALSRSMPIIEWDRLAGQRAVTTA